MSKTFIFLYVISALCVIDAARILAVFPIPSISHQVVFRAITQELVNRGHEVVVITTDPAFPKDQAPVNLTEIDIHNVSYNFLYDKLPNIAGFGQDYSWLTIQTEMTDLFQIFEVQIKSESVQKLIREKNQFDLLLIEAIFKPALVFSDIFKAPVISISSFGATLNDLDIVGAPTHPIVYPNVFKKRLYNLSHWEKLQELYNFFYYNIFLKQKLDRSENELLQKIFGHNLPTINELTNNIDLLFLNVHTIWMDNQPMPPGVVFMGGIHQKPKKELPQDLKSYLDSSKNGVIYVSFGTNLHPFMFTPESLKVITGALSELPYDILMKWSDEELPGTTNNINTSKWFPQSDLLRHPKVKAFVMQGGLQSTDEAITAGVPLVCIPMLGDQGYNADKYVRLGIGLKLDIFTLTKSDLKDAIQSVIMNESYRENIVKLRDRMNDQPQSPLERAVWWIEYVLRHGGARHLRSPAANMSWAEYYELELVSIVLISVIISIVLGLFLARLLWNYSLLLLRRCVKEKRY